MRIEPAGILKRADNRVLRLDSKIDCRVSQRKIEINQQGFLLGFLGQRNRIIASQRGGSGTAFGAEKNEQPAVRLFRGTNYRPEGRCPNQSFRHGAGGKGYSEKLTS